MTLLINNAGINLKTGIIAGKNAVCCAHRVQYQFFRHLRRDPRFSPVLAANGGGAIVNMLSILGRVSLPAYGSYCASKAAGLLLTQGVRAELAKQGTLVVGVMPGATDTDVERDYRGHKEIPTT